MPEITIIAGPPGIGKTSASETLMAKDQLYLNQDYFYLAYKEQQNANPNKAGSDKFTKEIFEVLDKGENFGYETNLGYTRQYDDLKRVIAYKPENKINLHLFFTEDVGLCWQRAENRFNTGGHYVSAKTIFEMYNNTFPLLKSNISLFNSIRLYDVKKNDAPLLIAHLDKQGKFLFKLSERELPDWAKKQIFPFLEAREKIKIREDIPENPRSIKTPKTKSRGI